MQALETVACQPPLIGTDLYRRALQQLRMRQLYETLRATRPTVNVSSRVHQPFGPIHMQAMPQASFRISPAIKRQGPIKLNFCEHYSLKYIVAKDSGAAVSFHHHMGLAGQN